jgi:hypothetical protein
LAERAWGGGLGDGELRAICSALNASVAVGERFWEEIAVLGLVAYMAELSMVVERGLEKIGPSHGDRDAMHGAASASEAIGEKLQQEIGILVVAAQMTVVAMGDEWD